MSVTGNKQVMVTSHLKGRGVQAVRTLREIDEQGTLTTCQAERGKQVNTSREMEQARVIHKLLSSERGTSHKLGHQKKVSQQGTLTFFQG